MTVGLAASAIHQIAPDSFWRRELFYNSPAAFEEWSRAVTLT
jgi:hypothetical protein